MESNYNAILEYLVSIKNEKKKKEPTIIEREQFCAAWVEMAVNEGFSENTERYLYNCASYCGAKPLKIFIDKCETNKEKILNAYISGKMFRANCDVTLRLLAHLFALLLNDKKTWPLLPTIIENFPRCCFNKDKKRLGTLEQIMSKYFFAEIKHDVQLPELLDMKIKQIFISEFSEIMKSIIERTEKAGLAKNKLSNIEKVQSWVDNQEDKQSFSACLSETSIDSDNAESKESAPLIQPLKVSTETLSTARTCEEELPHMELEAYFSDFLIKVRKVAAAIRTENVQQKNKLVVLSRNMKAEQEKAINAGKEIAALQDTIAALRERIVTVEREADVLRQTLEKKEAVIADRETEIAERVKMEAFLSRDSAKQADEFLQRIASKIRVEFRDFQDARDIPMSKDLGENLRLQLNNIFSVLENSGIKIR